MKPTDLTTASASATEQKNGLSETQVFMLVKNREKEIKKKHNLDDLSVKY